MVPTFERFSEFTLETYFDRNCTNGGVCNAKRRLQTTDEIDEAVQIANFGKVFADNKLRPIIDIAVVAGAYSDASQLAFTWTCSNFTSTFIEFSLNFTNTTVVSTNPQMEEIKINFIGKQYFAAEDGQPITANHSSVASNIPMQLKPAEAVSLGRLASSISTSTKAVVVSNFIMNLLQGGTLSSLFGAIGKLQIMVHLLITNVRIPANAQIYFSGLLELVTYSIVDTEPLMRKWLNLTDGKDFNPNFYALGYHSVFFAINLGPLLFVGLYQVLVLLFVVGTKRVTNPHVSRLRAKAKASVMWGDVLTYINEGYIVFVLSCAMQYKYLDFGSRGTAFSSVLALVSGVILIASPLTNLGIMLRYRNDLGKEPVKEKYESLYDKLNYESTTSLAVLLEPFLTQMRILVMCLALIYLDSLPIFQIIINTNLTTLTVIFIKWFKVYKERDYQFFQEFNEVFVWLITYHLICFSGVLSGGNLLKSLGISAIVTITVNLVVNFGYILFMSGKENLRKAKIKFYTCKRDRLLKRIQKRQQ